MPRNEIKNMDKRLELGIGIKFGSWNEEPWTDQEHFSVILALQETRWLTKRTLKKGEHDLFFIVVQNMENTKTVLWLWFVIVFLPHVKIFKAINGSLWYIILKGRIFDVGFICYYGPIEVKQDEKNEEFFDELDRAYGDIPRHCIKVLLGDFNAKIGREDT